jgi:hypothetical protein
MYSIEMKKKGKATNMQREIPWLHALGDLPHMKGQML